MAQTMLKVDNINVYYGNIHAVKIHHPEDHLRPAAPQNG